MKLMQRKYHRCEKDECEGVLLVDVESESIPLKDRHGNYQYYCREGRHIFSVQAPEQKYGQRREVLRRA